MRIFGLDISIKRSAPLTTETAYPFFGLVPNSAAGVPVTRETALTVPAIWSAVDIISKTLAMMPFDLMRETDKGSQKAASHPLYYITKREPSPGISGFNFRRSLFANACFGNAFARIYRNGIGRPTRLEIIKYCTPYLDLEGRRWYMASTPTGALEALTEWDVIHIKGISLDAFLGEDVIKTFRESIGTSIGADRFGGSYFGNAASPTGTIEVAQPLKPEQRDIYENAVRARMQGISKTGNVLILDGGAQFKKINVTPGEAMLNETRNFQVSENARIFGIPAHLLMQLENATFNNIETMNTQFVTLCLAPFATQTEDEFFIKTLTDSEKRSGEYFYNIDLTELLRGDTAARAEYYAKGISSGWLLRNEARKRENLNDIEGLDKPMFPVNMAIVGPDGMPEPITTTDPATPADGNSDNNNDNGQAASN